MGYLRAVHLPPDGQGAAPFTAVVHIGQCGSKSARAAVAACPSVWISVHDGVWTVW